MPDLLCHPGCPCPAISRIALVPAWAPDGGLCLSWCMDGDVSALKLPLPTTPGPADDLWRHSCCEVFLAGTGLGYREFNFSPSGQWAVYAFSNYRERISDFSPDAAPVMAWQMAPCRLELCVTLPPVLLPPLSAGEPLHMAASAVLESLDGSLAYFALAHPGSRPDFHHRDGFRLSLPAPSFLPTP